MTGKGLRVWFWLEFLNNKGENMKCSKCSIEISKEFKYAFIKNVCPACNGKIIETNNMACFVPLCELLEKYFTEKTAVISEGISEDLAVLIMTSFNVLSKDAKIVSNTKTDGAVVSGEHEVVIGEDGIRFESFDKDKSKILLQKMRDEALQGAVSERYGEIEFSEEVLVSENPIANAEFLKQQQKLKHAQDVISSGLGEKGSIRRSS